MDRDDALLAFDRHATSQDRHLRRPGARRDAGLSRRGAGVDRGGGQGRAADRGGPGRGLAGAHRGRAGAPCRARGAPRGTRWRSPRCSSTCRRAASSSSLPRPSCGAVSRWCRATPSRGRKCAFASCTTAASCSKRRLRPRSPAGCASASAQIFGAELERQLVEIRPGRRGRDRAGCVGTPRDRPRPAAVRLRQPPPDPRPRRDGDFLPRGARGVARARTFRRSSCSSTCRPRRSTSTCIRRRPKCASAIPRLLDRSARRLRGGLARARGEEPAPLRILDPGERPAGALAWSGHRRPRRLDRRYGGAGAGAARRGGVRAAGAARCRGRSRVAARPEPVPPARPVQGDADPARRAGRALPHRSARRPRAHPLRAAAAVAGVERAPVPGLLVPPLLALGAERAPAPPGAARRSSPGSGSSSRSSPGGRWRCARRPRWSPPTRPRRCCCGWPRRAPAARRTFAGACSTRWRPARRARRRSRCTTRCRPGGHGGLGRRALRRRAALCLPARPSDRLADDRRRSGAPFRPSPLTRRRVCYHLSIWFLASVRRLRSKNVSVTGFATTSCWRWP